MDENRILYLTKDVTTTLFIYYFVVFLAGTISAILALAPTILFQEAPKVKNLALLGSIGMALNGASIYYIRKLYKSCFSESLCIISNKDNYHQRLGTTIYFLARPLFAIGFSMLVVIGLQSGFMLTTSKPIELNDGFIYLSMFISFYSGFLSGKFIKKLEQNGEKVLDKILQSEEKNESHK